MAKKIPGLCVARFKPLRQIWYSGQRFQFNAKLGMLALIVAFVSVYIFFPAYVSEWSTRGSSEGAFWMSIAAVPVLVLNLIKFIRSMRHDGIYVSAEGVRVVRREFPPERVEAQKDPMFMSRAEVQRIGDRVSARERRNPVQSRLMCSPEIFAVPAKNGDTERWCIAFRSPTQVLERIPMRWIGADSEKAAKNLIRVIANQVGRASVERLTN